ncbi:MAG: hypothetical protein KAX10_11050 [Candidatus Lokiarchaeota archaeon]|nr:hypothetical protein [Candidatus Lokiarchaeota archaeon]
MTEPYFKPKSPALQRIICDLKSNDVRIQIIGYVKELISNSEFILKDNSGEIKVTFEKSDFSIKKDLLINVIGELEINVEGEKNLKAKFIQNMNMLNYEYYEKIYHLKKDFL